MLDTHYEPEKNEKELYEFWLKHKIFEGDPESKAPKYCIVLPPPNVTGVLHMGHALTCTLEDIIVRRKRMQGFNTLWVPGTDHAGIATQMVVERKLLKEDKISRHDLGREKFLEKVWEWKKTSETTILSQLKLMGCSLDWSRLSFTLDENVSLAVRECFVRLYNEGLLYRETAIIQWCPRCRTALSDLEVKFKETPGKFWYIKYVVKNDKSKWLTVATTRPETLLGDTAVAVHPEDERFLGFHNKEVMVPLVARAVRVIADDYVDKSFGTGALKITPGHDPNDYLLGKKHGLAVLTVMDEKAHMNEEAGSYKGLSREKAREKILEDLKAHDLLLKEEDHAHNVGHCDRCGTIVEPRVSAQWFVKAEELAKPAIKAVETKEIKIIPEEWEKTYFEWMRNIRPWCVSRQLWWGHRIPVWYCQDCKEMNVAVSAPTECQKCKSKNLNQEEDVLDTWFSSGLWPFSTLGWPKETPDFKTFYPNDVLETGFDILFFWVARMVMMGMKMTGKIPFHTVYLHPMVRDEHGQKMSKTKGNVVDPLEIISRTGSDSLRFFLSWNAFHGRDLRVSDDGVESCKHFVNKIWNASKFVLMHFGEVKESNIDLKSEVNQWIWTRLNTVKKEVNSALDQYRFFEAAQTIYHFLWSEYCDWFIEFIKSKDELESRKTVRESTAIEVLEETLRLLHPFMPFVTEKIWQEWPVRDLSKISISLAGYPSFNPERVYPEAELRFEKLIRVINELRTIRGTHQISPATEISVVIAGSSSHISLKDLQDSAELIKRVARIRDLSFDLKGVSKETHLGVVMKDFVLHIPKTDLGDITKEIQRKKKELEDKLNALKRAEDKLRNEKFMSSAPENVRHGVEKNRDDLKRDVDALMQYLKDLK